MIGHVRELLVAPAAAVARAKKEKNLGMSIGILLADWVLIGIALVAIAISGATKVPLVGGLLGLASSAVAVGVTLLGFVVSLFVGWPTKAVLNLLGGRGGYFEGLTPCAYGLFVPAIGFLVASLLASIPGVGFVAAFVVVAVAVAVGLATYFRALRELFGVDLLTAIVGALIVNVALMTALHFMVVPAALSGLWALPKLPLVPGLW